MKSQFISKIKFRIRNDLLREVENLKNGAANKEKTALAGAYNEKRQWIFGKKDR